MMRQFLTIALVNAMFIASTSVASANLLPYKQGDLARFGKRAYQSLSSYRLGDMNRLAAKAGRDLRRHLDAEHNRKRRQYTPNRGNVAQINYRPASSAPQKAKAVQRTVTRQRTQRIRRQARVQRAHRARMSSFRRARGWR